MGRRLARDPLGDNGAIAALPSDWQIKPIRENLLNIPEAVGFPGIAQNRVVIQAR
jgi:hypothetical protein